MTTGAITVGLAAAGLTYVNEVNKDRQKTNELKKEFTEGTVFNLIRDAGKAVAATKIQTAVRGYNARQGLSSAKSSATKIQAVVRGHSARQQVNTIKGGAIIATSAVRTVGSKEQVGKLPTMLKILASHGGKRPSRL